jgi:hypothetical protein
MSFLKNVCSSLFYTSQDCSLLFFIVYFYLTHRNNKATDLNDSPLDVANVEDTFHDPTTL